MIYGRTDGCYSAYEGMSIEEKEKAMRKADIDMKNKIEARIASKNSLSFKIKKWIFGA